MAAASRGVADEPATVDACRRDREHAQQQAAANAGLKRDQLALARPAQPHTHRR